MKTKTHALPRKATLGAAAASAVFALPAQADAAIVYSGLQNITATIGSGSGRATQLLNLDALGSAEFRIRVNRSHLSGTHGSAHLFPAAIGNQMISNGSGGLKKLASGANISAGGPFGGNGILRGFSSIPLNRGTWASNQSGFAGVQFLNSGNTLYGWIRLKWTDSADANPEPNTITAIDWAYNDTPNGSILAGQVPEPSQALLALAGLGAVALRRRRKEA